MTDERYERFNAMTFEVYCKVSIDRAINRGRRQKWHREQHLNELSLAMPCEELEEILEERTEPTIFRVSGFDVPVHDETLARALLSLTPQRRRILLLAYFLHETDEDIARDLKLSRSAVQRRRASALELMRQMMGGVVK